MLGQLIDGGANRFAQLAALRLLIGSMSRVGQLPQNRAILTFDGIIDREKLHALFADVIDAQIGSDFEQPARKGIDRVVTIERIERLHERFLRQVASLFRVANHFSTQVEDRALVLAYQLPICDLVALLAAIDQEKIFLLHGDSPLQALRSEHELPGSPPNRRRADLKAHRSAVPRTRVL